MRRRIQHYPFKQLLLFLYFFSPRLQVFLVTCVCAKPREMWSLFSRDPAKDFPFEIGDKVLDFEERSIWNLHEGKHKVAIGPKVSHQE